MNPKKTTNEVYLGLEQGPIRPPNEARSLLVRVTRNCPWNRCTFCPVYKQEKFSVRPAEHVIRDIDLIHQNVERVRELVDESGRVTRSAIERVSGTIEPNEWEAFSAAVDWVISGDMRSVFLQDADSLVMKPAELVDVLTHLKTRFPTIRRITSYARAKTIARRKERDLRAVHEAGLDRIHVGLESGSDQVLAVVDKGSTKAIHLEAGLKVKRVGMELSEYVMPGLGGRDLSTVHAVETADALNQIGPDFIRIRTLAIPPRAPLYERWQSGDFEKCSDVMVAEELRLFIEKLDGITSVVKSDHILNLFMEVEGKLPDDKERMLNVLKTFLAMDPTEQRSYQVGRRLGVFHRLGDLKNDRKAEIVERTCRELGVTSENVDQITDQLMMRFV
ncbi:MAG: radical SAM protein [Candidatus Latescibacterota bacterium]|nr:MAG: radical SAM protein [Candidatus Latescibacterota bacterium]